MKTMGKKYNEILCWGAQHSPEHYPMFYTRTQKLQYRACLGIWRLNRKIKKLARKFT